MKRLMTVALSLGALVLVAGVAFAQMGGGMTGGLGGMMGGGMGMMGGGSMMGGGPQGGPAGTDCHGAAAGGQVADLTADKAKEIAEQYASQYLPGFYVAKVESLAGMHMTMYSAEARGPKDDVRILHINPWGGVMVHGDSKSSS